jgi:type I restriction enzyme S subunit
VELGDVVNLRYGKALRALDRTGEGFPVYGSNGPVGYHDKALTSGPTIVVGRKGSFGEVHFSSEPCWPIDTTYYIDGTCTAADLGWLTYVLGGLRLTELNSAAAVPGLNRDEAYRQTFLLPPIEEQRRIAAVLGAADALRAKRREALAQLDTLTQVIFVNMFGNAAAGARDWPTLELSEVVAEDTTVTYGIVQAGEEYEGGVPYIRTGDIVDGAIRTEALRHTDPQIAARFPRSRVRSGEIVISIRATVGTTARVPPELEGANLTQGTARISPGEAVTAAFLLEHLRSHSTQQWLQRQVKGATFREITLKRLRELPVRVPPLGLQQEFQIRSRAVSDQRLVGRRGLDHLESLFASLQQRAFRGEL